MSINDFEDTVLWLGRSISTNDDVQKLIQERDPSNLIGVFGIGLMSCFGVAEKIIISSSKSGFQPFQVEIGNIFDEITPSQNDDAAIGTTIIIQFNKEQRLSAKAIVDKYFWNVPFAKLRIGTDVSASTTTLMSRSDAFGRYSRFEQIKKNVSLVPTGGDEYFFQGELEGGHLYLWHDSNEFFSRSMSVT